MNRSKYQECAGDIRRGMSVTVADVPGVWTVYGPSELLGRYYLEPVSVAASVHALSREHGMIKVKRESISRHTQTRSQS